ncbi:MAG: ABC transporter permease [Gemmatimonadota bacterium]|nr:ABC transporter permease [Gemmatimonadota bacterium]
MTRLELAIAWRYLRSRRGSKLLSFISVIAIAGVVVGVSALIIIIGVMNGLQHDLREKILVGSPDIRVLTYGEDLKMDSWRFALKRVREVKGVVAAAPFVQSEGAMNAGRTYASGVYVVGIPGPASGYPAVTSVRQHAIRGSFSFESSDGKHHGVVIGQLLASRFNVWPGDTINLISVAGVQQNAATGGYIPRVYQYQVTGVFRTGMYEYDNAYVYIGLPAAQEFAGIDSAVTGIEVATADRWNASVVANAITEHLGFPYRTVDWEEQNHSLFQALKLEKLGMGVILLLIVIVAAFNIVSTLSMVVHDKTREIGILKAMGLRSGAIRNIFLVQGLVIGAVGTGLGLVLGFSGALALDRYKFIKLDPSVYFIDHLPVTTQPRDVIMIVVASLLIAALATLYPAIQAAKLYPVDAIRSE